MGRRLFSFMFVVVVLASVAAPSQAAFVMTIQQEGSNVVATGTGSINLAGLFQAGGSTGGGTEIYPAVALADVGSYTGESPRYVPIGFQPFSGGVSSFGDGVGYVQYPADSATGDFVEIQGANNNLSVPPGYVSGAPLSGTATWDNQTIAGLTLIPGSYTWSWGSDGTADSFTVNIVGAAVTPEPSAFILGGLGLVGLLVAARRRKA